MTQNATKSDLDTAARSKSGPDSLNGQTFLRDTQVAQRYGVSRVTIWRWVKDGHAFPKPIKLTDAVTRWKLSDLEAWEAARAAA
ncbi:helix-turn-helix transcriptional regulator [Qingshengfaniella alkalisoli]|uniref:AlpA family phage regulatory protein n=1 Tax=Qingshengfaniella alkalisoli TaxID=2599296 RepID=A0A5B8IVZ8_9RHOB|nr:AlpA family phage regulatory protein [Qingshengfaniella alkalisoli]QDY69804.1 AlpA family phage regulatory protein [Qingshengfaniella alkalisoli]